MTNEERSWILYDVANSAFILIMVTAVMPIFFKEIAAGGLTGAESTSIWGYAVSTAALVTALAAPFLGAMADYKGKKLRLFTIFLITGITATIALTAVNAGDWVLCFFIFIVAKIAWAGANIFYDSFITDVTTPERTDRISSHGYAWGYIGSTIPFIAVIIILMSAPGGKPGLIHYRTGFIITAVWWILLSIPMIKNVRQKHFIPESESPLSDSIKRLVSGLKNAGSHKNAYLFLLAYFFYIDGVDTIISMAGAYGIDSGLSTVTLISAILAIQILAFPFAIIYGKLAEKFSAKKMVMAGIAVYTVITFIAFFLPEIKSYQGKVYVFWFLSFLVATSMGGIQALSRSLYSRLIPAERSAEFFGLYNIFGKFAAILGPFMMGLATQLTGNSRYGIICVLVLFFIGGAILHKTDTDA
ncbi:MAG TPA: MFS transporter [Spirochaetota bacterium]|nr:MFS transporter [Spirochaetota bacterium]